MSEPVVELPTGKELEYLNDVIREEGLCGVKLSVKQGSSKGDNYIGQIFKVEAKGIDVKTREEKTVSYIVKCSIRGEELRSATPIEKCYQREIFMYTTVLPAFEEFQKKKGVLDIFNSYPHFYKGSVEGFDEFLIMADKSVEGFRMTDRKLTLDLDHCNLVLKELGKYHAVSFAMKNQNPELFKTFSDNAEEYFIALVDEDEFRKTLEGLCTKASKALDAEHDLTVLEKFNTFSKNAYNIMLEMTKGENYDEFGVMTHGDCWSNNILFKYNDDSCNELKELCFLDWQESKYVSPVCDISNFLYNCTNEQVLEEHFDEIIETYYLSLSNRLKQLGTDPEIVYPFTALQKEMKRFFRYGLVLACYQLNMFTAESDEIPDLEKNLRETGSVISILNVTSKNVDMYNERIRAAIRHAAKKGFI